jgi:GNAT superfamily N-acetyltransferase
MKRQIPDINLFMMCVKLNKDALDMLPAGFYFRSCRENELGVWKAMHFDDPETAKKYSGFMSEYFNAVYGGKEGLFYKKCLFACNTEDKPVGTCFVWKSYDKINTIQWFKVVKEYEGIGIGRALLSEVMRELTDDDYEFDEKRFRFIGRRKKRVYRLGDKVKIVVKNADLRRRTVDFALV